MLSNARRRELAALRSARQRRKRGDLLVEGPLLLQTLLQLAGTPAGERWAVRYAVVAEGAWDDTAVADAVAMAQQQGVDVVAVADAELAEWAATTTPQGLLAVVRQAGLPELDDALGLGAAAGESCLRALVLDGVQDPGNVGTLIRSAAAFGVPAVVLCRGCADPTSPKALRAAMGATFAMPVFDRVTHEELLDALNRHALPLVVADVGGEPYRTFDWPECCALGLGGEVAGLSASLTGAAGRRTVGVPQRPQPQSINVAMAGSVLLAWCHG